MKNVSPPPVMIKLTDAATANNTEDSDSPAEDSQVQPGAPTQEEDEDGPMSGDDAQEEPSEPSENMSQEPGKTGKNRRPRLTKEGRLVLATAVFERRVALFSNQVSSGVTRNAWQEVMDEMVSQGIAVPNVETLRGSSWTNLKRAALKRNAAADGADPPPLSRTFEMVLKTIGKRDRTEQELAEDEDRIRSYNDQGYHKTPKHYKTGTGKKQRRQRRKSGPYKYKNSPPRSTSGDGVTAADLMDTPPPTDGLEQDFAVYADEGEDKGDEAYDYVARQQRLEQLDLERHALEVELLRMKAERERDLLPELVKEQIKTEKMRQQSEQIKQKLMQAQMSRLNSADNLINEAIADDPMLDQNEFLSS